MPYLLDSNSFIQPKNQFYSFETHPAFWEWLMDAHRRGAAYSIQKVQTELLEQRDELSKWVKKCADGFFEEPDGRTVPHLGVVSQWVQDHPNYTDAAKQEFFRSADYYLIAQARQFAHTVVTFEKHENSVHRVKIPSVCSGTGVQCCNLFQMLKAEGAKF